MSCVQEGRVGREKGEGSVIKVLYMFDRRCWCIAIQSAMDIFCCEIATAYNLGVQKKEKIPHCFNGDQYIPPFPLRLPIFR